MHDLNDLLDASAANWEVLEAYDVGNDRRIVGVARHHDGRVRAVLLDPVPCP
jgi:hypothetical protein